MAVDEFNEIEKEEMSENGNSYTPYTREDAYDKVPSDSDEIRASYEKKQKKKKAGSTGKGILIGMLIVLVPLAAAVAGSSWYLKAHDATLTVLPSELSQMTSKLSSLQEVIDYYYLFDYDTETLKEDTYAGFVSALGDPYTCYYTEEEYKSMMESTSGSYYGIGVMISQQVDTGKVYIVRVFSGSPALESGMEAGDVLYTVGGQEVTGMDLNEVVSLIKGAEGTTVEIVVYREKENDFVTLNVERREVDVDTVYWKMLDDSVGYIELTEFDSVSTEQIQKAVEELTEEGMTSLVLDLRSNPGGLLNVAVDIADIFIDTGKVVSISDKYDNTEVYEATEEGALGIPMTVLVNGDSASASEVLSGCLKDYGAATLVGTQTFGKGIVQKIIPFGDGTALKVTIAHYYTPEGSDIHGVGITPDLVVEDDEETADIDEQLNAALEVLKEK